MTRVGCILGLGTGLWLILCGAEATGAALPGLDRLEATRSRPLFNPLRRPPAVPPAITLAAPVAAPAMLAPPPDLKLNGVIIGPDRTIAIVRRAADAKLISLEVGRDIDGWSVAAIRSREVELRSGSRSATLRLPTR